MASRQEEKERRRQERLEYEATEQRAAAHRRRVAQVVGAVTMVVVAAAVFLLVRGSGGNADESPAGRAATAVKLPEQRMTDLGAAVRAAGCEVTDARSEGQGHEDRPFTAKDYGTNPPSSGTHDPVPAQDGVYAPGNPPELGPSVHALEHGRINVQYRRGTTADRRGQLEALIAENGGYHTLLYENQTEMRPRVAATAWTKVLSCPQLSDRTWDALRTFRDRYVDKGPEVVP